MSVSFPIKCHLLHKFSILDPKIFTFFEKRAQNLNTLAETFGELELAIGI